MTNDDPIHELKNSLGIILGFAELLLDDTPLQEPRHADLCEIKQAAERAMDIVRRFGAASAEA